jgi:hypothetical protein
VRPALKSWPRTCVLRNALSQRHTSRQRRAAVTPSASSSAALRPVECNPAGGGVRPKDRARNAALRQPAPARHSRRPLRSRRLSRARPIVTGGDPAAPIGCRERLSRRRAGGSACALADARPRFRSRRSLQEGRMAPRCAKPRARPATPGRSSPRAKNNAARPAPLRSRSARTPPRTPPASLHRCGFRAAVADRSG